jgi:hypothetical protein
MRAVSDNSAVAQTSEFAVSQVSKPAGRPKAADLEVGDTADSEVCATPRISGARSFAWSAAAFRWGTTRAVRQKQQ